MPVWSSLESWEAGFLAGAIDADGCFSNYADGSVDLLFSQRDNELLSRFLKVSEQEGFNFAEGGELNFKLRGGKTAVAEFLGSLRPPRLLGSFSPSRLQSFWAAERPLVTNVRDNGIEEVVVLQTSTGTLVVEGFAMHNCLYFASPPDPLLLQSLMRQWKKYGQGYELPLFYLEVVEALVGFRDLVRFK